MAVIPRYNGVVLTGIYTYIIVLLTLSAIDSEYGRYHHIKSANRTTILHSFYIRTPQRFAYRVSTRIMNNGSFNRLLEFHRLTTTADRGSFTWFKITTDDDTYFTRASKYPELFWTIHMLGKYSCYLMSKTLVYTKTFRYSGDTVLQVCRCCRD